MTETVTDLEMEVLRAGAGLGTVSWGAWVSACMEGLHGKGLIQGESNATPTEAGWDLISKTEPTP